MTALRNVGGILVAGLVCLIMVPPSASGAVTVGQTFAPDTPCTSFTTYAQSGSASGQYSMPSDGVITSWSHQAGPAAASIKFKVLRPAGGDDFDLVGESQLATVTAGQLNTFATRIPVQSGDVVGAFFGPGPNVLCGTAGDSADEIKSTVGDVTGTGVSFSFPNPNAKLSFSASLEADADNDGFGDETQDQCPADPSTQGPCATPAKIGAVTVSGPAKVKRGRTASYKVKVSNRGGSTASGVKVGAIGKGLSGRGSAGTIAAGKSKTVTVRVKPKKTGKVRVTFKVTSANAGAKSVSRTVTVKR